MNIFILLLNPTESSSKPMKLGALLVSIFSLLTVAGFFLVESITTPLGTTCRIKTGLAALFYGTFAGLLIYGLLCFADH